VKITFNNNYISSTKYSSNKNLRSKSKPNFTGGNSFLKVLFDPFSDSNNKAVNWLTDKIAKGYAPILRSKPVEKFVTKYKNTNITAHLSAVIASTITLFYIKKTLENDKLDSKKRTTLAINQALVAIVSLLGSYKLEKIVAKPIDGYDEIITKKVDGKKIKEKGKHIEGFVDKFRKVNTEEINAEAKNIKLEDIDVKKLELEELLRSKKIDDSQIESLIKNPVLETLKKHLSAEELIEAERIKRLGKIDKWVDGIRVAKTLIIFGFIFRFFAPVVVTPIANAIGNKLNAKKEPKTVEQKPAEIKK